MRNAPLGSCWEAPADFLVAEFSPSNARDAEWRHALHRLGSTSLPFAVAARRSALQFKGH